MNAQASDPDLETYKEEIKKDMLNDEELKVTRAELQTWRSGSIRWMGPAKEAGEEVSFGDTSMKGLERYLNLLRSKDEFLKKVEHSNSTQYNFTKKEVNWNVFLFDDAEFTSFAESEERHKAYFYVLKNCIEYSVQTDKTIPDSILQAYIKTDLYSYDQDPNCYPAPGSSRQCPLLKGKFIFQNFSPRRILGEIRKSINIRKNRKLLEKNLEMCNQQKKLLLEAQKKEISGLNNSGSMTKKEPVERLPNTPKASMETGITPGSIPKPTPPKNNSSSMMGKKQPLERLPNTPKASMETGITPGSIPKPTLSINNNKKASNKPLWQGLGVARPITSKEQLEKFEKERKAYLLAYIEEKEREQELRNAKSRYKLGKGSNKQTKSMPVPSPIKKVAPLPSIVDSIDSSNQPWLKVAPVAQAPSLNAIPPKKPTTSKGYFGWLNPFSRKQAPKQAAGRRKYKTKKVRKQ